MERPGNVRPLNRRLSDSYTIPTPLLAERMKSYTLVFVVLATILLYTEYANTNEICPQENCVVHDKCDQLIKGESLCHEQGTSCCSVVKSEFRTHCRHHGGVCTDTCSPLLKRETQDCTGNQVCCVLV
ncbi:PREDICTED: LOW QUALITY PROTEIN: uncharacterized protein LOC105452621 [Wasmannia auropunctata]|uniref:LOW QUALITY PROTEIN: uncharacterized protein LOC105452621 n=1 Tax=Wasmannia auropunctata TaxID=64793 RepID=UPI0005F09532|nr:PREDICTED: LOW QUALITY PROTEIN: uncharacterized protein LOC105452621 [Wasmannia auropunctata]